jgi:hypothetical protein
MACFEVLFYHLYAVADGKREKLQSGLLVSRPRFEPRAFKYEATTIHRSSRRLILCSLSN